MKLYDGMKELNTGTIRQCSDAVFSNSVLMVRVCSTKGIGLFMSLTMLYPLVGLEDTTSINNKRRTNESTEYYSTSKWWRYSFKRRTSSSFLGSLPFFIQFVLPFSSCMLVSKPTILSFIIREWSHYPNLHESFSKFRVDPSVGWERWIRTSTYHIAVWYC